jgi:hypothetical protein
VATWPAASARRSSPSSPWRRTGGAPLSRPWTWPAASAREELLLAAMASGARRDKEAGREGAERCSQRGSRRREGGAAPARSSATAGAVRRGDEIGQPDGVGVVVGVVLGKNGEMGTTVPRRGYIYPVHWSRLVASTGTKGQHWYRLVAQTGTKGFFQHPKGRETETFGPCWWHKPVPLLPFSNG